MAEHDRRHVLAPNARIDTPATGKNRIDLADKETRNIEDMGTKVEHDEALLVIQVGLRRLDVLAGAKRDARP